MQGLRTARARELLQACRLQGSQGPAHAPAAAAAPPVVSGADERRGEKYTRGSSAAAAAGWPASHCSAVAPRGSGTCAPVLSAQLPHTAACARHLLPERLGCNVPGAGKCAGVETYPARTVCWLLSYNYAIKLKSRSCSHACTDGGP